MLRHTFYATQKILRNLDNIQKNFQSLNRNKKQKYICNGPSLFKIEIEKIIELLSARKKLINSVWRYSVDFIDPRRNWPCPFLTMPNQKSVSNFKLF